MVHMPGRNQMVSLLERNTIYLHLIIKDVDVKMSVVVAGNAFI